MSDDSLRMQRYKQESQLNAKGRTDSEEHILRNSQRMSGSITKTTDIQVQEYNSEKDPLSWRSR